MKTLLLLLLTSCSVSSPTAVNETPPTVWSGNAIITEPLTIASLSISREKCPHATETCDGGSCWLPAFPRTEKIAEMKRGGKIKYVNGGNAEKALWAILATKVDGFDSCTGEWKEYGRRNEKAR